MKNKYRVIILIILIVLLVAAISIFLLYKDQKVSVLCYHNIATEEEKQEFPKEQPWIIDVNNFEDQLKYLKKHGYKTLTLEEFYRWKQGEIKLPYKSVLITFDDGFLSNYQYAFPLLKKYDMNATVFLIGNYMKPSEKEWDGNVKTYMTKQLVEKCKSEYSNIEFASHSYGLHEHGMLENSSYEELVQDGKTFKEEIVNTDFYCYPFGAYNENMIKALKENEYKLGFTFGPTKKEYRKASRKDDNYQITRLNMSYGMDIFKFAIRLSIPF